MTKKTILQKIFGTAEERKEHSLKNVIKSTFAGVSAVGIVDKVCSSSVVAADSTTSNLGTTHGYYYDKSDPGAEILTIEIAEGRV